MNSRANARPEPLIRRVKENLVFESPWVRVFHDEVEFVGENRRGHYSWIRPYGETGGIMVIPRLPDGRLMLIQLFRYPAERFSWEFPAGLREEGESPETTAAREMVEETGITPAKVVDLGWFYPDSGLIKTNASILLAELTRDAIDNVKLQAEEHIVDYRWLSLAEVYRMIASNELFDGISMIALAKYAAYVASEPAVR